MLPAAQFADPVAHRGTLAATAYESVADAAHALAVEAFVTVAKRYPDNLYPVHDAK